MVGTKDSFKADLKILESDLVRKFFSYFFNAKFLPPTHPDFKS